MKQFYYYLLPCLFFLSHSAYGQVPAVLDSTFNNVGFVVTSTGLDDDGEAVAVGPNGTIYVAGASEDTVSYDFLLQAYLTDGSVDMSFGNNGTVIESSGSGDGYLQALVVQADGKIVSVGFEDGADEFQMFRHLPDGSRDISFAQTGKKTVSLGDDFTGATDVLLQPDGKIVVGMVSGNQFGLYLAAIRYLPNGNADSTFGINGLVYTNISSAEEAAHLALQADGKLLLAGTTVMGQDDDFVVSRFSPAGIQDSSFGNNGVVQIGFGDDEVCSAVGVDDAKAIYLAGSHSDSSSSQFVVAKTDSMGNPDIAYINQAGVLQNVGTGDAFCTAMEVLNDGTVLLAGDSEDTSQIVFTIVKLEAAGTRDITFAPNGILTTPIGSEEDLCNAMTLQADGKIILVGESDDGSGNSDIAVARYLSGILVGIEQSPFSSELKVYPNPLQESITLEFVTSAPGKVSLQMLDLQGKVVVDLISPTAFPSGQHRQALVLPSLSPGIYFLHLMTPDGPSIMKVMR